MYVGICLHCHWISKMDMKFNRHLHTHTKTNRNKIDIDFNPKYFIDALKVIEEEEISLSFNGNMGPCVLRPVDNDDFAYLVLPLRR